MRKKRYKSKLRCGSLNLFVAFQLKLDGCDKSVLMAVM